MLEESKPDETQIKLYSLLVDQLHKYNTIIWQTPTALLAANAFSLDKFSNRPPLLLALVLLDAALIFAFQRMVKQQSAIICAAQSAEARLKTDYPDFIPDFAAHAKVRAPNLVLIILWCLALALATYTAMLFLGFGTVLS